MQCLFTYLNVMKRILNQIMPFYILHIQERSWTERLIPPCAIMKRRENPTSKARSTSSSSSESRDCQSMTVTTPVADDLICFQKTFCGYWSKTILSQFDTLLFLINEFHVVEHLMNLQNKVTKDVSSFEEQRKMGKNEWNIVNSSLLYFYRRKRNTRS